MESHIRSHKDSDFEGSNSPAFAAAVPAASAAPAEGSNESWEDTRVANNRAHEEEEDVKPVVLAQRVSLSPPNAVVAQQQQHQRQHQSFFLPSRAVSSADSADSGFADRDVMEEEDLGSEEGSVHQFESQQHALSRRSSSSSPPQRPRHQSSPIACIPISQLKEKFHSQQQKQKQQQQQQQQQQHGSRLPPTNWHNETKTAMAAEMVFEIKTEVQEVEQTEAFDLTVVPPPPPPVQLTPEEEEPEIQEVKFVPPRSKSLIASTIMHEISLVQSKIGSSLQQEEAASREDGASPEILHRMIWDCLGKTDKLAGRDSGESGAQRVPLPIRKRKYFA